MIVVACVVALLSQVEPVGLQPGEVLGRLPGSWAQVRALLPGYVEDVEGRAAHAREPTLVLHGSLQSGESRLSLFADGLGGATLASADFLAAKLGDPTKLGAERFDVGGTACAELRSDAGAGLTQTSLHAFPMAGGYGLHLQVSSRHGPGQPAPLGRAGFVKVVESLRFAVVRRGSWEQLPPAVQAEMHRRLRGGAIDVTPPAGDSDSEADAKDGAASAAAWVAEYARAELLNYSRAPRSEQQQAYERAVQLLAEAQPTGRRERHAWMLAEEGLGVCLQAQGLVDESIAPLERAAALGAELQDPERGGPFYNLACSRARQGDAPGAAAALAQAIAARPRYRDSARQDPDFASVRAHAALQALLSEGP